MPWHVKRLLLFTLSGALLITGGALLWQPLRHLLTGRSPYGESSLSIRQVDEQHFDLKSAFKAESVKRLTFLDNDKDIFDLLLVNYKDGEQQLRNVLLFPKVPNESLMLPSPTGQRQTVWQDATETISEKSPKEALFLSWWDDAQRIHFLTGRDVWLNHPGSATFKNSMWHQLQSNLTLASTKENEQLSKMARWLTMDSEQALQEIQKSFGISRPIYLLINNDLLMHLTEISDYGGTALNLTSKMIPVSHNLHNDISRIKQMAQEDGDGNYLIQKEGLSYHLWLTPKNSTLEKNTLLIRLLPFVDSLKKLPKNVELVYQSHWGGFLSVYRINTNYPH